MHFTIVSYTFPPSQEIGGRRWAKFSKHLKQLGHEVTVICAKNSVEESWYDQEYCGIKFNLLPRKYPKWLEGTSKSLLGKLLYHFSILIWSPLTKKNLFDKGFAWEKPMKLALKEIHKKKPIDILVVTGAPFSLISYGADFKEENKEIQYIVDIRDPWTWGSYYGISEMSFRKKNYQEQIEYNSIKSCDMFCFPTKNMGDFLIKKYPQFSSKFYQLSHAFDAEKFPKTIVEKSDRKGFIYGGTLYNGIENDIQALLEIINANPDASFKWDIYSRTSFPIIDTLPSNSNITKHSFIPEEELFKRISQSSAYLVFFPTQEKDLVSTKFFEIINTVTPILYIGEEGDVGRFIRENRLGVHILPENLSIELPQYLNGDVPFEPGYFDVNEFTFTSVTQKFLEALVDFKNLPT